ncbi:MAG: beta-ketoacyl synthase [Planctomycetaceae bacterium]
MSSSTSARRVVITGLGVVSPIGIGVERFWESLSSGKSGIGPLSVNPAMAAPHNVGAEVRDFTDATAKSDYLKSQRRSIKVMCREIQLGVTSASLALSNSALDPETVDHERFGIDFGANLMFTPPELLKDACMACVDDVQGMPTFDQHEWGSKGIGAMEPLWLLRYLPNMPACHIGIQADARGPSNSITLDDASGNLALGEAYRVIERDRAEIMIAGTTGTRIHTMKSIHAMLGDEVASYDDPPETWCRPFDLSRRGQVLGEGACSFILEEEAHAEKRNAKILGRILGVGSSCVMRKNGTPDYRLALANAMKAALRDAKLKPAQIGHINANGCATRLGDKEESLAIHDVFGDGASKVPVTALKSYMGNAGSGAGTLELAGSVISLMHGVVPQTLNYKTPDPECAINVVHGEPMSVTNRTVLKVNVTRLGQASAIIVEVA